MNRAGLTALLAIIVVAAGAYFYLNKGQSTQTTTPGTGAAGSTAEASTDEAMLFTWENWANPPFLGEYKEKHGKDPLSTIWADEDEAFAKMRAGFKPDVMAPCSYEFERWQEAGLIQPIDVRRLKYWKDIPDALKKIPGMMKSE